MKAALPVTRVFKTSSGAPVGIHPAEVLITVQLSDSRWHCILLQDGVPSTCQLNIFFQVMESTLPYSQRIHVPDESRQLRCHQKVAGSRSGEGRTRIDPHKIFHITRGPPPTPVTPQPSPVVEVTGDKALAGLPPVPPSLTAGPLLKGTLDPMR